MRIVKVLLGALLVIGIFGPAVAAEKKALCLVCKVHEGTTEEEVVKAVRTHAGVEYGFCSEACAEKFAADPAAYVPAEFPFAAPKFSFRDLSGKPISNQTLAGQVVLLDFWATWCAPCRKTMPELQALHVKYADRGFSVVGVSIDEGGPAKVRKYVASKKYTYPIAMDSEKAPAWDAFKVKAIPAAFLLDREGRVVAQWTGAPANGSELESKVAELLKGD